MDFTPLTPIAIPLPGTPLKILSFCLFCTAWFHLKKFCYRCEAEMEYLKIAQDLEMFAIGYFPIKVSEIFVKGHMKSSLINNIKGLRKLVYN